MNDKDKFIEEQIKEFKEQFGCCEGDDKFATCQCYKEVKWLKKTLTDIYKSGLQRAVDEIRKAHYELEEWSGSVERPKNLTHFEANQKNMEMRNRLMSILQEEITK